MSEINNALVNELTQKIGDQSFYSLRQIVNLGVFGSMVSARRALKDGRLSSVKISPRRSVILRQDLLNFLQNNLTLNQAK
jgi:hypothetical protein